MGLPTLRGLRDGFWPLNRTPTPEMAELLERIRAKQAAQAAALAPTLQAPDQPSP
jgi:hypothetical protein